MIEALINRLLQVLAWPAFGFFLIGAAFGFLVGILPGLDGISYHRR